MIISFVKNGYSEILNIKKVIGKRIKWLNIKQGARLPEAPCSVRFPTLESKSS